MIPRLRAAARWLLAGVRRLVEEIYRMATDLLPGSTTRGGDTPPTVKDTENDSYTFTNTVAGVGTTGGVYADCGVSFQAPTTGRVILHYAAQLANSGAGFTSVTPVVREGGTVGSGTTTVAASDNNCVQNNGVDSRRFGASLLVENLVAGDTYNVRLEHRVGSGTGTALRRHVIVTPAT